MAEKKASGATKAKTTSAAKSSNSQAKSSSSAKKAPAKKAPATKKAPPKKTPIKKTTAAKKAPAAKKATESKKAPVSKKPTTTKKAPAAKSPTSKKAPAKKAPAAKKAPDAKKAPAAKKTPAKKSAVPSSRRVPAKRARARKKADTSKTAGGVKKKTAFKVGDKVVHPHHGAAEIVKRVKENIDGETRQYFQLRIATETSLMVMIPIDSIDETIRPVISKVEAGKVLEKFGEDPMDSGTNWSRWYKVLTEKMTSGDIFQVAEVVRDLTHAQHTKGISPALKRMHSKARTTLSSELAYAMRVTPETAARRIENALPDPPEEE